MCTISEMHKRFVDFKPVNELKIILGKRSKELIAAQKNQFKHGKNSDGKEIGYYRSDAYASLKNRMNALPGSGVVDLILTGEFINGIFVDIGADEIKFDSNDSKTSDLTQKYNKNGNIFGLNSDSNVYMVENFLQPDFIDVLKNKTGAE